jgi:hypothetical protein
MVIIADAAEKTLKASNPAEEPRHWTAQFITG